MNNNQEKAQENTNEIQETQKKIDDAQQKIDENLQNKQENQLNMEENNLKIKENQLDFQIQNQEQNNVNQDKNPDQIPQNKEFDYPQINDNENIKNQESLNQTLPSQTDSVIPSYQNIYDKKIKDSKENQQDVYQPSIIQGIPVQLQQPLSNPDLIVIEHRHPHSITKTWADSRLNEYIYCLNCHTYVTTEINPYPGICAWLTGLGLCVIGCWPCACLPCCLVSMQDIEHRCPRCGHIVGQYIY